MNLKTGTVLLLLLALALGAAALVFAPLNQDEGWYLAAARRVADGELPYRDFAFTQGPLLPFVYQAALPLVERFGLAGARGFTGLLALLTLGATLDTAGRGTGQTRGLCAAALAAALLGLNTFQAQYATTVKTYALAGLPLMLGLSAWLAFQRHRKNRHLVYAGLMLAAAAATRLSLGLFFLPLGLALLADRKALGHRPWLTFALAGLAGLALAYGPFLVLAPEGLRFGLLEFHAGRQVDGPWLLRAGFLARATLHYLPALAILLYLLLHRTDWKPGARAIGAGIALVSLVHLLAPFPYDDYQAAVYPALVWLVAAHLPGRIPETQRPRLAAAVGGVCLLFALSSPQIQDWFSAGRDRIWWNTKSRPDLATLRETADHLRELAPEADTLLTMDAYLAIEAGMDLPRGLEMGPFSYFPDLDTERARRLHVLNAERLQTLIRETDAPLAAVSGYGFSIRSPQITKLSAEEHHRVRQALEAYYHPVSIVDPFGQANTRLEILVRKPRP